MKDQGFREIFGFDKLGLKQINDTLRALWKKVMGGLDWRDLAGPTREVIDSKAERVELAALDIRAAEEAERLRNYAETIEAKADSGAAGVLQVREDLKLYATREETAQKITSEVLRVEGETDEKLKAYATLQQTAERISAAVTQIDKELTRYATLEQTADGIHAAVGEIEDRLGGYASIDMLSDQLALKVSTAAYERDRIHRQDQAPQDPEADTLWLDTSTQPSQLKRWTGGGWAVVNETDTGWRNYVQDSEYHELDSMGSYYTHWALYKGLEQGVDYVLSVGRITALRGAPTQVAVLLFDYDVNQSGPRYLLNVSQQFQQLHFVPPIQADRNWSLLIYNGLNGQTYGNILRFEHVKLEKGVKATDWTPAPEDPATTLATNNGVTINRDGVFIDTNRFDLNLLNSYGETVLNMSAAGVGGFQQLRARRMDAAELYIDGKLWRQDPSITLFVDGKSGSDGNPGSRERPYKTIQYALSQLPKCIVGTANVYIQGDGGPVYDGFNAANFYGPGRLWISNTTSTLYKISGDVNVNRCACEVNLNNAVFKAYQASAFACVSVSGCTATQRDSPYLSSIELNYGGFARVENCLVGAYYGVMACHGARVHVDNVKGTCSGTAIGATDGGILTVNGARPAGAYQEYRGGKILSTGTPTPNPNDPVAPPTPTETTNSFACSAMATWRTGDWRTDASGAGRAVQAHYSGGASGNNVGCFFFNFASLAGRTVKSATISLTRPSAGGRSDAVTPFIGVHSLAGASGAPSPGSVSAMSPGLSWGESRSYDVTAQLRAIAAAGGAGGLCLYDSGNSAGNYLVILDKPTVTVTYV